MFAKVVLKAMDKSARKSRIIVKNATKMPNVSLGASRQHLPANVTLALLVMASAVKLKILVPVNVDKTIENYNY